jgi:hypothetical protein
MFFPVANKALLCRLTFSIVPSMTTNQSTWQLSWLKWPVKTARLQISYSGIQTISDLLASRFFRYLKVEVEANSGNRQISQMYFSVISRLKQALASGNNATRQTLATIATQKV